MSNMYALRSVWLGAMYLTLLSSQAQSKCRCTAFGSNTFQEADTVIRVSKNFNVAICGYRDRTTYPIRFSEFTLYTCADQTWGEPLPQFIAQYSALEECTISVVDTTVIIDKLALIPQGESLTLTKVPCLRTEVTTSEISLGDISRNVSTSFVASLPRPNKEEVADIQRRFDRVNRKECWTDEHLLGLVFLCAANDLPEWRVRFNDLGKTHMVCGAVAELYEHLSEVLLLV